MKNEQNNISDELTPKQKIFCEEYIKDWNATRAAIAAGYSEKTAKEIGSQNLTKLHIQEYIKEIRDELEKQAHISKLLILLEWKKIALSSISNLHETWLTRKDFNALNDEEKACIQEIDTKVIKKNIGTSDEPEIVDVEHIKVKMFDKPKALENICKMMGYFEPDRHQHKVEQVMPFNITIKRREY